MMEIEFDVIDVFVTTNPIEEARSLTKDQGILAISPTTCIQA